MKFFDIGKCPLNQIQLIWNLCFPWHLQNIYVWNWKLTWWYVCNEWKPDILIHYFEHKCYNTIDMGNRKKINNWRIFDIFYISHRKNSIRTKICFTNEKLKERMKIQVYTYVYYTLFLCGGKQEMSLKSSHCELRWKSVKKAEILYHKYKIYVYELLLTINKFQ